MKILLITSDNGTGGIQKVSRLLTQSLVDEYEVYNLIFTNKNPETENDKTYKIKDLVKLNILKPINLFNRIVRSYVFFRIFTFDYIIINNYSNILFRKIIKSKKYVLYLHTDPIRKTNFYNSIMLRYAKEKFDYYICVSEGLKSTFVSNLNFNKDKINVIYNPIEKKEIAKLDRDKKLRILSVGRYEYEKGHMHLINAVNILKSNYPYPIELLIVGSGPLKPQYLKLIDSLNLNDSISLIPWKKNIEEYYATSNLFILTSYFETYSMVLAEAIIYGLNIITTDCPTGPREIINLAKSCTYKKNTVRGNFIDNFMDLNDSEIKKNEEYLAKIIEYQILDIKTESDYSLDPNKIPDIKQYRQKMKSFLV